MILRILYVEDSREDVELVAMLLAAEGFECDTTTIETLSELREALGSKGYDIILCDYLMPDLDGITALECARELSPATPFVFVSGAIGEDLAIDCLKRGATDYVLKERLSRLAPVVRRALKENEEKRRRENAERLLSAANEQLLQTQKLEAVGRLTGGIAHDFNNILTAVKGYSELSLMSLGPSDPTREFVAEIQRAADRAAQLVQQLLAFSRSEVMEPRLMNVNEQLRSMEKLLGRVIGEDVRLELVSAPDAWAVIVDPVLFDQVVINLAINAREVMPKGGHLIIETGNSHLDESYAQMHPGVAPGDYVMIAVSDTGRGMSPEILAHLFEPFFTTKEVGQGLGLSAAYGIAKQSGGDIYVHSEEGRGTTFKVYFPRAIDNPARATSPDRSSEELSAQGTETILVVEDNQPVRDFVSRVLVRRGYTVLSAADGEEAVKLIDRGELTINLIIADVIMPGANGLQVAAAIRARIPNIKVIYMSGYTRGVLSRHGIQHADIDLLTKPVEVAPLLTRVRTLLNQTA